MVEEWKKNLDNNFIVGSVLIDLYKAFDHTTYWLQNSQQNSQQFVQIINKQSESDTVISDVPQDSMFGPVLYHIFFNDFFFFILNASVHNFALDNTLASFASALKELMPILESECEAPIN